MRSTDDPELHLRCRPGARLPGRRLGKGNARELGINYVIWHQHIWNIERDAEGWRYMADRGSDSANHINHVHITVY